MYIWQFAFFLIKARKPHLNFYNFQICSNESTIREYTPNVVIQFRNPGDVVGMFGNIAVNTLEIVMVPGVQVVENSGSDKVVDDVLDMHEIVERFDILFKKRNKIHGDTKDVVWEAKLEIML